MEFRYFFFGRISVQFGYCFQNEQNTDIMKNDKRNNDEIQIYWNNLRSITYNMQYYIITLYLQSAAEKFGKVS